MDRLAHYELLGPLGEGGMGVVYKARDVRLGRLVAIKLLPPDEASDPQRRRRFVHEAQAASALNHPNILTVHEVASEGDVDFIVTELVEGKTLSQLIPPGGMHPRDVLAVAAQIADALAAAHAAGIVHRDVKPANVMVTPSGLVKVLDFGLAKLVERGPVSESAATASLVTRAGTVVGTAAYMSPEQAEGHDVDARSDVFSLGAVLYEMVTGKKAFARGSMPATLAAILRDEPEPVRRLSGAAPPELEHVVHRCLRKEQAKRFQTMADLRGALEQLREAAAAPSRRRPARSALVFGVVAAVAAVLGGAGWWLAHRAPRLALDPSPPVPLTSFTGRVAQPALSPDGRQVAFIWNGEKGDSPDLYVKLVGPGVPVRITSDGAPKSCPAWSPDGRQIAFSRRLPSGNGALVVLPALGGAERIVAEMAWGGVGVSWFPDGRSLVVCGRERKPGTSNSLYRVGLASGELRRLTKPPPELMVGDLLPAISADGRSISFSRVNESRTKSEIYLLRLTSEGEPQGEPVALTSEGRGATAPTWTPDGRIVFALGGFYGEMTARLMVTAPWARGRPAERVLGGEGGGWPSCSPQGNMVFVRFQRSANVWRLRRDGSAPAPFLVSTRSQMEPSFSPDGRRMLFSSDRSGKLEVWACDADGGNPAQLTTMNAVSASAARFSPDGKRIAFCSNPEDHMDVFLTTPNGTAPQRLTTEKSHDTLPTWSRDGAYLYFASNREGNFQVWKMRPEQGAPPVRVTRGGGYRALESADGRTVYYSRPDPGKPWSIWKVPVGGGEERLVVPALSKSGDFDVTAEGLYYIDSARAGAKLRMLRFHDGADVVLATLEKPTEFGVAVSPLDGSVFYSRTDVDTTELMLVERLK